MLGKKVTIIGGLGKMGQWLIPFFNEEQYTIQIHSRTPKPSNHQFISELTESVISASWVILATPINATKQLLEKILAILKSAPSFPVVCDIASVKEYDSGVDFLA